MFALYDITPNGLILSGCFDEPEQAMGSADAHSGEEYPEWHYTAPNDTRWYRIWTRNDWYIQEEK